MCNRYTLVVGFQDDRMGSIVEICNRTVTNSQKINISDNGDIQPTQTAPALLMINSKVVAASMQWGFENKGRNLTINARSETAKDRLMFKTLVDYQRCALPAAGYYEWRDGDNLRYMIAKQNGEPFYLAGLYRSDKNGRLHFVVMTRSAYGPHAKIHNRMPCVLRTREEARRWISGLMPVEMLYDSEKDDLKIDAQGVEQLRMEFDD